MEATTETIRYAAHAYNPPKFDAFRRALVFLALCAFLLGYVGGSTL